MPDPLKLLGSLVSDSSSASSLFNVKIPAFSLSQGFEYTGAKSLGGLVNSVVSSAQNLLQGAKLAYCVGKMITDPSMMLGVLDTLGNNILAAATEIAGRLANLVKGQIDQALAQISGTITGFVNNVLGFLGSIVDLAKAIANLYDSIMNIGFKDWEDFMSEEDCEYIFAALAACMLNKFLGNKLQELERKLSDKIISAGTSLNSAIAENLADVNSVSSYVERERFMMEKATKQINGINNLIS